MVKNKKLNSQSTNKLGGSAHQLFSDTPSEKELSQCFTCEYGLQKFTGGAKKVYANIDAVKGGKKYSIEICYGDKYELNVENKFNNKKSKKKCKNMKELREALSKYSIENYEIAK